MELNHLTREAGHCGVLDTGYSSSVSGTRWVRKYVESLEAKERQEVRGPTPSNHIFRFGNNRNMRSKGTYLLPAMIGERNVTLEVKCIDSNITLLLSSNVLKRMDMLELFVWIWFSGTIHPSTDAELLSLHFSSRVKTHGLGIKYKLNKPILQGPKL